MSAKAQQGANSDCARWPRRFDPELVAPYIAAHDPAVGPRIFFQATPRGVALSGTPARSRLISSLAAGSAALSLINFRGFGQAHSYGAR